MDDQVKSTLDELKATSLWLAALIATTGILAANNAEKLKLLDAEVSRAFAAQLMFCVCILVLLHLLRLMLMLQETLRASAPLPQATTNIIRFHPWAFNPFSESSNFALDCLGVVALIGLWWIGALAGMKLLKGTTAVHTPLAFGLFITYCLLGVGLGFSISNTMPFCMSARLVRKKRIVAELAVFAGMWIVFQFG